MSEWVVTSSPESSNPASSGQCCFNNDEEFSSTENKQAEVGELNKCSCQASTINT